MRGLQFGWKVLSIFLVLAALAIAGCSNNFTNSGTSLTVDLGYNPASLYNTLDNVQLRLTPYDASGQVITVNLGDLAGGTVFGGLRPGLYTVEAVGFEGNTPIAFGRVDDILVTTGDDNETFVVVAIPQ